MRQTLVERDGVGVPRPAEDLDHRPLLDHAAGVHHGDAVAGLRGHADVVRDDHLGDAQLLAQPEEQVEDLGLDGHVERGGRLVGDEQRRPAGQRHGHADALSHAAAELVRVALERLVAGRKADLGQRPERRLARLLPRHALVDADDVLDLVADLEHGVERGQRVLEHHGDLAAAEVLHLLVALGQEVLAAVADLAAGDLGLGLLQQAEDGEPGDGLAAAGLAHEAEDLAVVHADVDAVQRLDEAAHAAELQLEAAHPEEFVRHAAYLFDRGSRTSRRPSPTRLKASTRIRMARPAKVPIHHWSRM